MKLISLKYDYAFRELFSHESIRKFFISDVTGIPLESIKTVQLTTPYLWKRYQMQKQGILDVAVILNDDTRIDIELQIHGQEYWLERNLFYLAKMYTDDLKAGQRYDRLRKCITISILDFELIPGEEYHTAYTLRDKNGRELTGLFELHFIELRKKTVAGDAVGEWIRLFNAKNSEELEMIKTKNAGILEAMEVMKRMSLSKRLRRAYEMHLKAVRDRWAEDEYVRKVGHAEGHAEGKAEGKAETLLMILESKGEVPETLRSRILTEGDTDKLEDWVRHALSCSNIDEFITNLE